MLHCTVQQRHCTLYTLRENKVSPLNDDIVIQSSLVTNGVTELILESRHQVLAGVCDIKARCSSKIF